MLSFRKYSLKWRFVSLALMGLFLSACNTVSTRAPVEVVQPKASAPEPPKLSEQALQNLEKMNALQTEIRELRNQLEKQQFDMENLKQRQQDLFQSLDQRMRVAENMQQGVLPAQGASAFGQDPAGQQQAIDRPVLIDQNRFTAEGTNAIEARQPGQSGQPRQQSTAAVSDDLIAIDTANKAPIGTVAVVDQQLAYDQGFTFLKQSRYNEAIGQFTQLVEQHPNGGLADDASYWIGEANYVNRQYEAAIQAFRRVVTQYPSSDRVPEALLKVGYVQYDIGDYKNAKQTFEDVLRRYAGHPVSISAKSRLQRIQRGLAN